MQTSRKIQAASMLNFTAFVPAVIVLGFILVPGCNKPNTRLIAGMKMGAAVDAMNERGLESVRLAYTKPHNAFGLPSGSTIVLIGEDIVDEIQVIKNPDVERSERITENVLLFEF